MNARKKWGMICDALASIASLMVKLAKHVYRCMVLFGIELLKELHLIQLKKNINDGVIVVFFFCLSEIFVISAWFFRRNS